MDTNDRRFQDALHQLTTAFFNFLDVVNPSGVNQADDIRYISQLLQNLSSHLGGMAGHEAPLAQTLPPTDHAVTVENPQTTASPVTSQVASPSPETYNFPASPNMFKASPVRNESIGQWVFRKLEVLDGDGKCFEFYISGDRGKFTMKSIPEDNWSTIYQSRERILANTVVTVEGEIIPTASLECLEPGLVRKDPNAGAWVIEKPCRVKINPA